MNHWPELIQLLSHLRDQLALHFSLEEAYGYFDEAINVAPELSLNAMQLRSQHGILFKDICDLADKITEVVFEPEAVFLFTDQLREFQRDFEDHEEAELNLILNSLGDDSLPS